MSRSIGRGNYHELAQKELAGESFEVPAKDIEQRRFEDVSEILKLVRAGAFLRVSLVDESSQRLVDLHRALEQDVDGAALGFSASSTDVCVGPVDLTMSDKSAKGEEVVGVGKIGRSAARLVDVGYFGFSFTCDDYRGNSTALLNSLPHVPAFVELVKDLEEIVGPVKLFVS